MKNNICTIKLLKRVSLAVLPMLLIVTLAAMQGCAANKCDCPRFSGHRLAH